MRNGGVLAPDQLAFVDGLSRRNLRSVDVASWTNADVEKARRRMRLEAQLLAAGDLLAIGGVASFVVFWSVTAAILILALVVALVSSGDYRRPRVTLSVTADMPRLLGRLAIPVLLVAIDAAVHPVDRWIFTFVVCAAAAVVLSRFVTFGIIRRLRVHNITRQRAIVVGAGLVGTQLAAFLDKHAALGIEPVGFVDDSNGENGMSVLGPVARLPDILARKFISNSFPKTLEASIKCYSSK